MFYFLFPFVFSQKEVDQNYNILIKSLASAFYQALKNSEFPIIDFNAYAKLMYCNLIFWGKNINCSHEI